MKTSGNQPFSGARLHVIGQTVASLPLDARLAGHDPSGLNVLLRAPIAAGMPVRLEVDGGQVFGTAIRSEAHADGFRCIVAVERVMVRPSPLADLAAAVDREAQRRKQWAANPAIA